MPEDKSVHYDLICVVHLWCTCPHLFCSCSRENNEPPETYWVTMANWLGSSRHAPTNWMIQGWLRRQRMETSLQNMSTSDFEQYVLALYLLKTTAERRRNQTTPHISVGYQIPSPIWVGRKIPFYGDNFVSAFASVDFPKGACECNSYAHQ